MERLEVSGAGRPIYGSLGVKWLTVHLITEGHVLTAVGDSFGNI